MCAIRFIACNNDEDKVNPKLLNSLVKILSYLTCTMEDIFFVLASKVTTWNWMRLLGHIWRLLIELFTLSITLPYSLFNEFKLLGYSDN